MSRFLILLCLATIALAIPNINERFVPYTGPTLFGPAPAAAAAAPATPAAASTTAASAATPAPAPAASPPAQATIQWVPLGSLFGSWFG